MKRKLEVTFKVPWSFSLILTVLNMKAQMFRFFTLPVVACCMLMSTACGDIIISIESKTITAGSANEYVDVFIEGDTGDTLGRFGYEFQISGAGPQSGDLQFRTSYDKTNPANPLNQTNSEQNDPTYVFYNDTDPVDNFTAKRGALGTDPLSLVGGDQLASLDFVDITGPFLLARLELQHIGPVSPGSYAFTISLNLSSPVTEFDQDYDPLTATSYTSGQISVAPGSGIITVNAAAVPEPSSMALLAVGGLVAVVRHRRRKRIRAT